MSHSSAPMPSAGRSTQVTSGRFPLGTAACRAGAEILANPDVVKVVTDAYGRALYFSRAPIPFLRDAGRSRGARRPRAAAPRRLRVHAGSAALAGSRFRRTRSRSASGSNSCARSPTGSRSASRSCRTRRTIVGIDTEEDLAAANARWSSVHPPTTSRRDTLMPNTPTQPQHSTKFIFVTGGVVSSLGKGIAAASLGRLLVERGLRVTMMKFDPYINVDPGHDEPVPARRGVRHRRRRRDGPRPRPLRTLHRPAALAAEQRHDGPRLPERDHEGAPRRIPRLHGAGDPAHHRRDQVGDPAHGARERRGDRRDRRHGGRHRVAAVPRGDPPIPPRRRPRERALRPPDARAVHRGRGRGQDQADAALGARAHGDRDPARRPDLPHASARSART